MSWRTITEDDVYAALNSAEASALRAAVLRSGQEDPMEVCIRQVTRHVRDAIRSHPSNSLDVDATKIPAGLVPQSVDLVIYRLGLRLDRVLPITEARTEMRREAERYLDKIAKGEREVESPTGDGTEVENAGAMEQLTPTRRRADREGLSGL